MSTIETLVLFLTTNKHPSPRVKLLELLKSTSASAEDKTKLAYLSDRAASSEEQIKPMQMERERKYIEAATAFGPIEAENSPPVRLAKENEHQAIAKFNGYCQQLQDFLEKRPRLCDELYGNYRKTQT